MEENLLYTVSLFMTNKPGVLLRIATIFSRRGINIDSLAVTAVSDHKVSRMTISCCLNYSQVFHILKNLKKLIDVIDVNIYDKHHSIDRELALIRVSNNFNIRDSLLRLFASYGAKILELTSSIVTVQFVATTSIIDDCLNLIAQNYNLIEVVRTGRIMINDHTYMAKRLSES